MGNSIMSVKNIIIIASAHVPEGLFYLVDAKMRSEGLKKIHLGGLVPVLKDSYLLQRLQRYKPLLKHAMI